MWLINSLLLEMLQEVSNLWKRELFCFITEIALERPPFCFPAYCLRYFISASWLRNLPISESLWKTLEISGRSPSARSEPRSCHPGWGICLWTPGILTGWSWRIPSRWFCVRCPDADPKPNQKPGLLCYGTMLKKPCGKGTCLMRKPSNYSAGENRMS